VLKKESDILRGREPDVGGDPVFFLQYQREQQHTNIALMLWITMEVAEGNYTATSFIAEFVSQFVAGGHGETIAITFKQNHGQTRRPRRGTYDVVYTGVRLTVLGF
jgi:hypothetical protein